MCGISSGPMTIAASTGICRPFFTPYEFGKPLEPAAIDHVGRGFAGSRSAGLQRACAAF